jgi:transposase
MRIIGLDIHRAVAEAVAWDDGQLRRLGRVAMRRDLLEAFARTLGTDDVVVIEATGNASAVAAVIGPYMKRVVIANPKQVRIMAHAKIKTDTIDAGVLAPLYASGFLPEVWIPDEATPALRRQVTRRNQIVKARMRFKNIMPSILHAHLIHYTFLSRRGSVCIHGARLDRGAGFCRPTSSLRSTVICERLIGSVRT